MEEDKAEIIVEEFRKSNIEKEKVISGLQEKLANFEKLKAEYLKDEERLEKLYAMGIIDHEGEYIPYKPDDRNEML